MVVACAVIGGLCYTNKPPATHSRGAERLVCDVTRVPGVVSGGEEVQCAQDARAAVSKVVREWVHKCILRFGRMDDTPADRRVLRLWLAEEMKKADMRDKDAVALIPTVIEFMYIPGQEELVALEIRSTMMKKAITTVLPSMNR